MKVGELVRSIEADRQAGTPGPWRYSPWHVEEGPDAVYAPDDWLLCTTSSRDNARRIARVPDMEERILSDAARITALEAQLEEMAGALSKVMHSLENRLIALDQAEESARAALTAYRKTQEGGE